MAISKRTAKKSGDHQGAGVLPPGPRRVPAKRFGDPAEFGDACAYLCSAQAGFITGQSLLMDGGTFPGAF